MSVLSLNTEREGADVEAVAGLADAVGADVLVLPETTQRYGRRLAEALTEKKGSGAQPPGFAVFSDTGMPSDLAEQGIDQNSDPAYSTTVLVASLVDAVGDVRPQNMPGTGADQYPNWCVPLCDSDGEEVFIEDLPSNERLTSLFSLLRGSVS